MPSSTVEDYVKAIYALQREADAGEATVVRVAEALGVTKGSVTAMVRKLRDARLVNAERYGGIRLTAKGRRVALDVIRRHRLIEVFLVDVLQFDWSEVHEEAERLEHAMSPKLMDRLDAFLGRPTIDPHGDPIPDAAGRVTDPGGDPITEFDPGDGGAVVRVSDQDPEFLDFAAEHGLRPGARVTVVEHGTDPDMIRVKAHRKRPVDIARSDAEHIIVQRRPTGRST
jgi:DtxR family Mn-dependent transcriptional regulator